MKTRQKGAGRRRVSLDHLLIQWKNGSPTQRSSINRNWARSVRAMLAALLAEHPEAPVRPMPLVRLVKKYEKELKAWWKEPFGPDGVPVRYRVDPEYTVKLSDDEHIESMVGYGIVDVSMGLTPRNNPSLWAALLDSVGMIGWMAGWEQRHQQGAGGDRPRDPPLEGASIPNNDWEAEDYQYIAGCEVRSLQCRLRSTEWCKANNVAYNPKPLEQVFHHPLLAKVFGGEDKMPPPPAGQAPLKLPIGPNGRRLVRQIFMNERDELGCILREQTEEEAEQERRSTTWTIGSWYDPPGTVTPREHMRPFLEGTEHEYLLEQYADYLIQYDKPD